MAAQPHGLLVHGHPVGENSGLGQDAGFIDAGGAQHLGHSALQSGTVLRHGFGALLLHGADQAFYGAQLCQHIVPQLLALPETHGVKILQGLLRNGGYAGRDGFGIQVLFLNGQYIGEAADAHGSHVIGQAVFLGNVLNGINVALQQRLIHLDSHIPGSGRIHRDKHVHLAPADMPLHGSLNRILSKKEAAGQTDRSIQITVIHTLQFHADLQPFHGALGPAVAGHAFDHAFSPVSLSWTISKLMSFSWFFFSRWLKTTMAAPTSRPTKAEATHSPSAAPAR